jgi:hypothetical protein
MRRRTTEADESTQGVAEAAHGMAKAAVVGSAAADGRQNKSKPKPISCGGGGYQHRRGVCRPRASAWRDWRFWRKRRDAWRTEKRQERRVGGGVRQKMPNLFITRQRMEQPKALDEAARG